MRFMPRGPSTISEQIRWALYTLVLVSITVALLYRDDNPADRRLRRIEKLIATGQEQKLYPYLAEADLTAVQFATQGLWECWLNERGPAARHALEAGMAAMDAGDFTGADAIFSELIRQHPGWAEPINKLATLRYLQRQPAVSLELCRQVVSLKPNHFGAWAGLAMCAIKLEDWPLARYACRQAARIQPRVVEHQRMLQVIEFHIPALDV